MAKKLRASGTCQRRRKTKTKGPDNTTRVASPEFRRYMRNQKKEAEKGLEKRRQSATNQSVRCAGTKNAGAA